MDSTNGRNTPAGERHPHAEIVGQIDFPELLTAKQVAKILGIRVQAVYELPIKQIRVGRRIRFHPHDLAEYIQRQRGAA